MTGSSAFGTFDNNRFNNLGMQQSSIHMRRHLEGEPLYSMDNSHTMDYQVKNSFEDKRPSMNTGPVVGNSTQLDDPYQPSMVQDLLQGRNEWKNIQDIVKLTFKAICDTVQS